MRSEKVQIAIAKSSRVKITQPKAEPYTRPTTPVYEANHMPHQLTRQTTTQPSRSNQSGRNHKTYKALRAPEGASQEEGIRWEKRTKDLPHDKLVGDWVKNIMYTSRWGV